MDRLLAASSVDAGEASESRDDADEEDVDYVAEDLPTTDDDAVSSASTSSCSQDAERREDDIQGEEQEQEQEPSYDEEILDDSTSDSSDDEEGESASEAVENSLGLLAAAEDTAEQASQGSYARSLSEALECIGRRTRAHHSLKEVDISELEAMLAEAEAEAGVDHEQQEEYRRFLLSLQQGDLAIYPEDDEEEDGDFLAEAATPCSPLDGLEGQEIHIPQTRNQYRRLHPQPLATSAPQPDPLAPTQPLPTGSAPYPALHPFPTYPNQPNPPYTAPPNLDELEALLDPPRRTPQSYPPGNTSPTQPPTPPHTGDTPPADSNGPHPPALQPPLDPLANTQQQAQPGHPQQQQQQQRQVDGATQQQHHIQETPAAPEGAAQWEAPPEEADAARGLQAHQFRELYKQVHQHQQLLVQLHSLAAKDPCPEAQQLASGTHTLLQQLLDTCRRNADHRETLGLPPYTPAALGMSPPPSEDPPAGAAGAAAKECAPSCLPDARSILDTPLLRGLPAYLAAMEQIPLQPSSALAPILENVKYYREAQGGRRKDPLAVARQSNPQQICDIPLDAVQQPLQPLEACLDPSLVPRAAPRSKSWLWTPAEDELLALGIARHGNDWRLIQELYLPTKKQQQVQIRQKNLCARGAASCVKDVKQRLTSPLTEGEIKIIREEIDAISQRNGLGQAPVAWAKALPELWDGVARRLPNRTAAQLPKLWRKAVCQSGTSIGPSTSQGTDPALATLLPYSLGAGPATAPPPRPAPLPPTSWPPPPTAPRPDPPSHLAPPGHAPHRSHALPPPSRSTPSPPLSPTGPGPWGTGYPDPDPHRSDPYRRPPQPPTSVPYRPTPIPATSPYNPRSLNPAAPYPPYHPLSGSAPPPTLPISRTASQAEPLLGQPDPRGPTSHPSLLQQLPSSLFSVGTAPGGTHATVGSLGNGGWASPSHAHPGGAGGVARGGEGGRYGRDGRVASMPSQDVMEGAEEGVRRSDREHSGVVVLGGGREGVVGGGVAGGWEMDALLRQAQGVLEGGARAIAGGSGRGLLVTVDVVSGALVLVPAGAEGGSAGGAVRLEGYGIDPAGLAGIRADLQRKVASALAASAGGSVAESLTGSLTGAGGTSNLAAPSSGGAAGEGGAAPWGMSLGTLAGGSSARTASGGLPHSAPGTRAPQDPYPPYPPHHNPPQQHQAPPPASNKSQPASDPPHPPPEPPASHPPLSKRHKPNTPQAAPRDPPKHHLPAYNPHAPLIISPTRTAPYTYAKPVASYAPPLAPTVDPPPHPHPYRVHPYPYPHPYPHPHHASNPTEHPPEPAATATTVSAAPKSPGTSPTQPPPAAPHTHPPPDPHGPPLQPQPPTGHPYMQYVIVPPGGAPPMPPYAVPYPAPHYYVMPPHMHGAPAPYYPHPHYSPPPPPPTSAPLPSHPNPYTFHPTPTDPHAHPYPYPYPTPHHPPAALHHPATRPHTPAATDPAPPSTHWAPQQDHVILSTVHAHGPTPAAFQAAWHSLGGEPSGLTPEAVEARYSQLAATPAVMQPPMYTATVL